MTSYSTKQLKFVEYLCACFGMQEKSFIDDFLKYYAANLGYFREYPSGFYFNTDDAVTALVIERDLRKNRDIVQLSNSPGEYIRATDLANYIYCPASFSIANSFKIQHPTGEKERKTGIELHEQLNLLNRIRIDTTTESTKNTLFNDPTIIEIFRSRNVYSGHTGNRKHFINHNLKIKSDPDYIFIDHESNHFVVEEKYHYKRDPQKPTYEDNWRAWNGYLSLEYEQERSSEVEVWNNVQTKFYLNHEMQLVTYLKAIQEYELRYGYLVYWFYDFNEQQQPYIHKVSTKKVVLDSRNNQWFNTTLQKLNNLLSDKQQDFNCDLLQPYKCAGCVVNKYCGHKNKLHQQLNFPYDIKCLKLYPAKFDD